MKFKLGDIVAYNGSSSIPSDYEYVSIVVSPSGRRKAVYFLQDFFDCYYVPIKPSEWSLVTNIFRETSIVIKKKKK